MSRTETVSYKSLFAEPGRAWFVTATAIGRTTTGMKPLASILLVQQITGSYGMAGLVGATMTLVAAIVAPILARMIDARGERGVLFWTMLAHIVGVIVLVGAAYSDLPRISMLIGAAIIGSSSVQFGSLSRARWVQTLGRGRALERAYSLEAMLDEVGFIIAPIVVVPLALQVHPTAGIVASMLLTVTASLMLLLRPATRKELQARLSHGESEDGGSVIRIPAIALIAAGMMLFGMIFGSAEIVFVAFAEDHGQEQATSFMVAMFAMGSLLGAVVYGAREWPGTIRTKLLVSFWWLGLGTIPILLAPNVPTMTIAAFVAGIAIAPAVITANLFVERSAPQWKLTEAFAWIGSAGATGAAIGSIAAGYLVDELGVRGGQWTTVTGGLAGALVVTLGWRLLETPERETVHVE